MEEPATVVIVPARQSTQVSTEEAPVAAEYLPTAQLPVHVEAPDADEYLPATQFRHVRIDVSPLVAEYLPASHTENEEVDVGIVAIVFQFDFEIFSKLGCLVPLSGRTCRATLQPYVCDCKLIGRGVVRVVCNDK